MSLRSTLFRAISGDRLGRDRGGRIIAATGACWRSTATRIGSIRSASRTASRWSPSSTGPAAGAMRPSARSTPLPRSWRRRRFRWSRRWRRDGETLHFHQGFRYAVFPRRGGRWPELGHGRRAGVGGPLSRPNSRRRAQRAVSRAGAPQRRGSGPQGARFRARGRLDARLSRRQVRRSHRRAARGGRGAARAAGAARAWGASSATATAATSCGPIWGRISSISMTA